MLTVDGRVQITRTRWHSPEEGSTSEIDGALDLAEATVSVGVRELICRLNQHAGSFAKTSENLWRAAQIQASAETIRQLVEQEGKAALRVERRGQVPIGWEAKGCETPGGVTRVYLGSDGVKVPLVTDVEKKKRREKVRRKRRRRGPGRPLQARKRGADQPYKEFKLVAYYDESGDHTHVSVTKGDHRSAGRLMRRDACRIALHEADQKVANVDGADWIRNQIRLQSLPMDAVGLDFYHLAENVHKARRAVFGEEAADGMAWAGEMLHVVKHQGYEAFWDRLTAWRGKVRGRAKRKAADRLLHYVAERRSMIAYPRFIDQGWQIGSGPTEALCKTITSRLKGRGRRWDADNAEAVATLSALEQSGQWELYWQTALQPTG